MTHPTPETVLEHLKEIDQTDTVHSAEYRQEAIEILADLDVNIDVRQEIAEQLDDANHLMTLKTVNSEDSY
jgi:hypothetical protein